ncbi:MAG: family 10 glycosylhydrolase [Dysgonamonadaceae bacterium]|nr:family 10 glycosylhydrolase [Dysgonamonadaceae bacterium]
MKQYFYILFGLFATLFFQRCGSDSASTPTLNPSNPSANKYLLWVDATANFPRLSNHTDSIVKYVAMAKEAGFTDLVVDVRPVSGEVLYNSAISSQLKEWKGFTRTATFDYLDAFITAAKANGLTVYAAINAFTGGHLYSPFWEQSNSGMRRVLANQHPDWIAKSYVWTGSAGKIESMWTYYGGKGSKVAAFLNPVNPDARAYVLSIINEIVAKYDVKGIVLDRGRFDSLESEFSDVTRAAFENYAGATMTKWPDDVFRWTGSGVKTDGAYYKKWLEFRASVIYNFFKDAKAVAKASGKEFAAYVGAWYSTYYNEGVNWASQTYDPSLKYSWATADYKKYGYAEELDFIMTGCYSGTVAGVNNYIAQAQEAVKNVIPVAAGLYVDDYVALEKTGAGKGKTAFYDCLIAGRKGSKNIMVFDMVHLNNELYENGSTPKYWEVVQSILK